MMMNAIDTNLKLQSQLARVKALSYSLENMNDWAAENAAAHLVENRPAFWSAARGQSNAPAGIFNEVVNLFGGIEPAIADLEKCYRNRNWRSVTFLDQLLPLNPAAVRDLVAAYERTGSFRSTYELTRRTDRAEIAADDANRATRAEQVM